jgi:hypothetical protein
VSSGTGPASAEGGRDVEKLTTGAAVFLAIVCGQPDLLAILCFYLFFAILFAIAATTTLRPARRRQKA